MLWWELNKVVQNQLSVYLTELTTMERQIDQNPSTTTWQTDGSPTENHCVITAKENGHGVLFFPHAAFSTTTTTSWSTWASTYIAKSKFYSFWAKIRCCRIWESFTITTHSVSDISACFQVVISQHEIMFVLNSGTRWGRHHAFLQRTHSTGLGFFFILVY